MKQYGSSQDNIEIIWITLVILDLFSLPVKNIGLDYAKSNPETFLSCL